MISKIWGSIWEIVQFAAIVLVVVLPIRMYVAQPFIVSGASMAPTFENGNYLIIDELTYNVIREPQKGEVIVFRYPLDPSKFFIKRIVGLPEETVEVRDNTVIIYNKQNPGGLILKEDYLDASQQTLGNNRIRMDDDEYFMMGDNRLMSHDSRAFGPVKKTFITGRAMLRLYPLNRIGTIPRVSN